MNPIRVLLTLLVLCFGATALSAGAADRTSERLGSILPASGTYIDWNTAGVSLEFDSGPGPNADGALGTFFMFHTYDSAGNQLNWIGQPAVTLTSEAERAATGVIAKATGSLYYAINGPCIGCTGGPPTTIVQTGINFDLVWTNPRKMQLTFSGARTGVFHLDAVNYASTSDDVFFPGTWSATVVVDSPFSPPEKANMAILQIDALPSTAHFAFDANVPAAHKMPPVGAKLYRMRCPADGANGNGSNHLACGGVMADLGETQEPVLWYDPDTKASGIESAVLVSGVYHVTAGSPAHFDMYVEKSNVLVGHDNSHLSNGDHSSVVALTLVRIPTGTIRDTYDYTPPTSGH